jgi:hypothetical protein
MISTVCEFSLFVCLFCCCTLTSFPIVGSNGIVFTSSSDGTVKVWDPFTTKVGSYFEFGYFDSWE